MNGQFRKKIFPFTVPIISMVISLVALELGVHYFRPIPYSIKNNMYFSPDPYTGYKLKPNSIGYFLGGIEGKTNSFGHRDQEITLSHPPNTIRILILGDSFTVGANVRQQEAYPQVLEGLLNKTSNKRIEVVNTGVGGWNPFNYSQYYEHYGQKFQPDIVLVGFFVGNDTYNQQTNVNAPYGKTAIGGRRLRNYQARKKTARLKLYLYEHFDLARMIINRKPLPSDHIERQDCQDFTADYIQIQKSKLRNHLKLSPKVLDKVKVTIQHMQHIKELTDRQHIPLMVALIPDENQINHFLQDEIFKDTRSKNEFDFNMPQSMLTNLLSSYGINTIDLLPAFKNDVRCLYMNDTHFNPTGQKLAAETIYNYIVKQKSYRKLLKTASKPNNTTFSTSSNSNHLAQPVSQTPSVGNN